MDKYSIFLSHIHEESDLALAFKEKIEKAFIGAVEVFVSAHEEDIRIGDEWFNEIESGLESAQTVILLLTPSSVGRPWINFEAGGAWFRGKNLIPVLAKGLEVEDLPAPFDRRQAVSLSDDDSIDRLISDIAKRAGLQNPTSDIDLTLDKEWTGKPDSSHSDEKKDPPPATPSSEDEITDSYRHHLPSEGGLPFIDSDILFLPKNAGCISGETRR